MNWLWQIFDPATIGAFFTQFRNEMAEPTFWVAVGKIIWINILLSGDNALVIALACRGLKPRHRLWGMIFGAGAAVLLRIIFTGIVASLMELPYLKLVGGLALIVIAAKLLVPEQEDEDGVESASHLWQAVQIVVVADIVMSLDNVIAVAAAANGSVPLLVLGLAISVPLIVAGAALIMALLTKLPVLVWAGAALLGWIAGEVIATESRHCAAAAHAVRRSVRRLAGQHARRVAHPAAVRPWWRGRRIFLRDPRRRRRAGRRHHLAPTQPQRGRAGVLRAPRQGFGGVAKASAE
ncbi:YjbE family integral membrane protein [Bradyrhizobium sp. LM3.6]